MDEKTINKFFGGSWNTFKVLLNEDVIYTPAVIYKNIEEEFNKLYKVIIEVFSHEDLICFFLLLDERNKRRNARQDKLTKFRVAISIEDSLLFCNRTIPQKYCKIFTDALNVDDLIPYDLSGSHPAQLLLFYRQAKNDYSLFIDHQRQHSQTEIPFSNLMEQIGTTDMPIPQIKKLSFDLKNAPLGTDVEKEGIRLKEVNVTMVGKSILEYYHNMVNLEVIDRIPLWIKASRQRGKTFRKINYN